jgi:hypothetical protein
LGGDLPLLSFSLVALVLVAQPTLSDLLALLVLSFLSVLLTHVGHVSFVCFVSSVGYVASARSVHYFGFGIEWASRFCGICRFCQFCGFCLLCRLCCFGSFVGSSCLLVLLSFALVQFRLFFGQFIFVPVFGSS